MCTNTVSTSRERSRAARLALVIGGALLASLPSAAAAQTAPVCGASVKEEAADA